jgi:hypothetical protein
MSSSGSGSRLVFVSWAANNFKCVFKFFPPNKAAMRIEGPTGRSRDALSLDLTCKKLEVNFFFFFFFFFFCFFEINSQNVFCWIDFVDFSNFFFIVFFLFFLFFFLQSLLVFG